MQNGVIVGVVQGGTFDGDAAFAISVNPTTGVVTVEQYLSLDHPITTDPNDALHMLTGSVGVTVTATDGDGDHVTSGAVDISGQITFLDDGPTANPTVHADATVTLDETGPTATAAISTGIIVKGDDPDVSGTNAISKATSGRRNRRCACGVRRGRPRGGQFAQLRAEHHQCLVGTARD